MNVRIEHDVLHRLRDMVFLGPDSDEQRWLLNEFKNAEEESAWWSDAEYDWFINRILNHLGIDESPGV